jgi:membrane protein DedA with SNARE-associated domain
LKLLFLFQSFLSVVIGGVLFITSGALCIESWDVFFRYSDLTMGSGVLAIILGVIYLADAAFTFIKQSGESRSMG